MISYNLIIDSVVHLNLSQGSSGNTQPPLQVFFLATFQLHENCFNYSDSADLFPFTVFSTNSLPFYCI